MNKFLSFIVIVLPVFSFGQVAGCTDPLSSNYNPLAEVNDGSCVYNPQSVSPVGFVNLSDTLQETSGLIHWDNRIWTHNDNTDTSLYAIDPANGSIDEILPLPQVDNVDWEEISQDANYIYVGDFGNNSSGNRTNLHILRMLKGSLSGTPDIDTIAFSYSNQVSFAAASGNTTNFDCEAFVVSADSIFLFTKRWGDKRSFLYGLPKTPGIHVAQLRDSLNVQGLITGATYLEDKSLLVLSGYSSALQPFMYALYDFQDSRFFSGNKRKFGIPLNYTQMEGISTVDGLTFYLSNERFVSGPANSPQRLYTFDMSAYLGPYLTASLPESGAVDILKIYPNPTKGELNIAADASLAGKGFLIMDLSGRAIHSGMINSPYLNLNAIDTGVYVFLVEGMEAIKFIVE